MITFHTISCIIKILSYSWIHCISVHRQLSKPVNVYQGDFFVVNLNSFKPKHIRNWHQSKSSLIMQLIVYDKSRMTIEESTCKQGSTDRQSWPGVGGQMVIIKWWYKNKLVIWLSNGDSKLNGDILFLNITKISPSD